MELIRSFAVHIPMIMASVALLIAALLKVGREKGSTLVVSGAVGMCVMSFATPLVYSVIVPGLVENWDVDNLSNFYTFFGIAVNILWAVSIVLIAVGMFLRQPVLEQHRPYHAYPGRQDGPPEL